MSTGSVTPERLRPHLEAWLAREPRNPTFVVHHQGDWAGADQVLVEDRYVDVRVCPSELAVREELARERPAGRALVLLCASETLGDDVLARVAKRRLLRLHAWDAVLHLFDVRDVDPRLLRERWMADALVESAPAQGYERTGARELDFERAWRALLRHRHGIDLGDGLRGLLDWAQERGRGRLAEVPEGERAALTKRLAGAITGAAPVLAAASAGHGHRVLALGLVARALVDGPAGEARVTARTLMSVLLGGWTFDESQARAWAAAAEERVQDLIDADAPAGHAVLQAADRAVAELQAQPLAAASAVLTVGLRRRLAALGAALADRRASRAGLQDVHSSAERVREHRLGEHRETATMVVRLVRWLDRGQQTAGDLHAAAVGHAGDEAYADWARTALRVATGEPALDEQLRSLVAEADTRRRSQDETYAHLLASYLGHAAPGSPMLGVEELLARVVAPLARQRPLLFTVLDGMSHRVACELLDDLVTRGWTELRPSGQQHRSLVLSTLPSVTAWSRTSLFTGALATGKAADEAKAFATHEALMAASARGGAPRLFHKGGLADPHGGLAGELRSEVAGDRRVIGVVVNAIDDHLARSDQLATPWKATYVPLLRALLDAASDVGRLVVIASDHGHVLDHDGMSRAGGNDHGERWRMATRPAEDGEVLVEGTRVLVDGGRCVLAADERVRYAPRKHGYHGGASPQETLAPLLVLTPGLTEGMEGWEEAPYDPPTWWTGTVPAEAPAPVAVPHRPVEEPGGQLTLEQPSAEERRAGPSWIPALLASDTFKAQRALAGRAPLPDRRIVAILATLAANNDRLLHEALARQVGIAPLRLTGSLAALRQLLNVDGYPVLTVDESTGDVILDVALLRAQFDLPNS